MTISKFDEIVIMQIGLCKNTLLQKGEEYAPDAVTAKSEEPTQEEADRLAHFKKAAAIMNATPEAALLAMLSKHIVSISDMCTDDRSYPVGLWKEKITDSINYLLILRAIVEEEQNEPN